VSLENFALMADDMVVWNDNERVLMILSFSKSVSRAGKRHLAKKLIYTPSGTR
jgi:hypothetical protein